MLLPAPTISVYTTNADASLVESKAEVTPAKRQEFKLVNLYPHHEGQSLIGFGGAVTETVSQLFWGLSKEARHAFLEEHFSPKGRNYRLVRTPVQSCDFGPGPHPYVSRFWQDPRKTFDLSVDEKHVIPMLQEIAKYNPDVEFLVTPWSPPAFMKTNHMMRFGGHLKRRYEGKWAYVVARYIHELRARGINVTRMTVQNEPRARQVWESCLMDAAQEVRLARKVRAHLATFGIEDMKILAWDHNTERILDRVEEAERAWGELGNPFDGWGFHWYAGTHFEAIEALTRRGDLGEFIMAEGCEYYSTDSEARRQFAEHYAHDIIGDLNAGANGWIDWNMMLDPQGGPTYVKNFCSAPVEANPETGTFEILPSGAYIAHFARFIEPGARRILATTHTTDLDVTAWKNPGGTLVTVVMNRYWYDVPFFLRCGDKMAELNAGPHSIQTVVWK